MFVFFLEEYLDRLREQRRTRDHFAREGRGVAAARRTTRKRQGSRVRVETLQVKFVQDFVSKNVPDPNLWLPGKVRARERFWLLVSEEV